MHILFLVSNLLTEKRESQLGTNTALVRTLRYSVFAGLVIHVAASIWYMFACVGDHEGKERRCEEGSWASAVGSKYSLS